MKHRKSLVFLFVLGVVGCSETTGTGVMAGDGGAGGDGGSGGMGGGGSGGTGGESRFDPSGCEVHVRGRWQVDGLDPNPDTCGNIALVELAIISEAEDEFWVPAAFALRCDPTNDPEAVIIDGGAYIDTRIATGGRCGGSGEILASPPSDEYKTRWRGSDDLRFVIDCSPIEVDQVTPVDGGAELLLDVGTVNLRTGPAGTTCPSR